MGNKYASIHVYGEDKEKILKLTMDNYLDKTEALLWENMLNRLKRDEPKAYYCLISNPSLGCYNNSLIIITSNCISIYDESNAFESIQRKTKELSSKIDSLITYTSNFDDDVFLIGAYNAGKLIASGKFGAGLPAYDMKHKDINVDQLCKILHINKTEPLCSINSLESINNIEDIIEEHLKIKLNLDIEEVESDKLYLETYSDNTFQIYKKEC